MTRREAIIAMLEGKKVKELGVDMNSYIEFKDDQGFVYNYGNGLKSYTTLPVPTYELFEDQKIETAYVPSGVTFEGEELYRKVTT